MQTCAAISIQLPSVTSGWELIMQSGVTVSCVVNASLHDLLHNSFAIPLDKLRHVDAYLLDGKPVDDLTQAIIPEGCRLALAAGLPGIAGLAMKSGSAIRGLRPDITHTPVATQPRKQRSGTIELALYSLTLPLLAGHFLMRGVVISAERLLPYVRLMTDNCRALYNGIELSPHAIAEKLATSAAQGVTVAVRC